MSRESLTFRVIGRPAPQGSKKSVGNNRFVEASKYLPAWRAAIIAAVKKEFEASGDSTPFTRAVHVDATFFIEKPAKPKDPDYPITPPDIDKYLRGLFDAITHAGGWDDDALVVSCKPAKVWTGDTPDTYPEAGALVRIRLLPSKTGLFS